jgi:hypothetical protein
MSHSDCRNSSYARKDLFFLVRVLVKATNPESWTQCRIKACWGPVQTPFWGPCFENFCDGGGGGCGDQHCQNRINAAFLSTIRVTFGFNPGPSIGRARYNCTPCTPLNPALPGPYYLPLGTNGTMLKISAF